MKSVLTKDEFEVLNDAFKPEYKESNGFFILDVDGIDDHPAVKGLKGAYTAEKDKRNNAAKRLDELEAEKKRLDEEKLFEQQKYKELAEIKDKESKEYADKLKALQDSVTQKDIDSKASTIANAINSTDAKRQKFLVDEARKYIKNTPEGIFLVNSDGSPTDEKSLITKLTTEFPFLAAGNGSSGGGANGSTNYNSQTNTTKSAADVLYPPK